MPRDSRIFTTLMPTFGMNWSTKQVTKRLTRCGASAMGSEFTTHSA